MLADKGKEESSQASVATSLKRNRNFIINQHEAFIVQSSIYPSLLYVVWGIQKNEKPETFPPCKTTNDQESLFLLQHLLTSTCSNPGILLKEL